MLHKQPRNRPALKQVLQLDIVSRAAPKPAAPAERALPPSWRKVPSASRPDEFSYQHVPTGYKQAAFPERDELPAEGQAALAKATFSPGQRPPPTVMAPPGGATPHQQPQPPQPQPQQPYGTPQQPPRGTPHGTPHGTPQQQHRQLGTPNQATPRQQGTPGARATPHDEASRALRDAISSALPPSWRKVPSASRPGEFSYQQSQPQQSLAAAAVACSRRHLARARIARVRSPNRCGLSALRLILRRCNARDTADGTRSNTVENRVSRGRV